jgi:hypothetical protein
MRRLLCISIGLLIVSLGFAFGQGMTFVGLRNSPLPPIQVAPGQIVTLLVSNTKTVMTSGQRAITIPLPTSLAGFSVSIRDYTGSHPTPILAVGQSLLCQTNRNSPDCLMTAVQIQIPFELTWSSFGSIIGATRMDSELCVSTVFGITQLLPLAIG